MILRSTLRYRRGVASAVDRRRVLQHVDLGMSMRCQLCFVCVTDRTCHSAKNAFPLLQIKHLISLTKVLRNAARYNTRKAAALFKGLDRSIDLFVMSQVQVILLSQPPSPRGNHGALGSGVLLLILAAPSYKLPGLRPVSTYSFQRILAASALESQL
jgi:hypothetical protein